MQQVARPMATLGQKLAGIALQLAGLFGLPVGGAVLAYFLWGALPEALYLANFGNPPVYSAIGAATGLIFFGMSSMMSSFGCLIGGSIHSLATENQLPWLFWTAARDTAVLASVLGIVSLPLYLLLGLKSLGAGVFAAAVILLVLAWMAHRRARFATRPLHIPQS